MIAQPLERIGATWVKPIFLEPVEKERVFIREAPNARISWAGC